MGLDLTGWACTTVLRERLKSPSFYREFTGKRPAAVAGDLFCCSVLTLQRTSEASLGGGRRRGPPLPNGSARDSQRVCEITYDRNREGLLTFDRRRIENGEDRVHGSLWGQIGTVGSVYGGEKER